MAKPLTEREMKHQLELAKIPRKMDYGKSGGGGFSMGGFSMGGIWAKIIPIFIVVAIVYLLFKMNPLYLAMGAIIATTIFLLINRVPFVTVFTVDLMILGIIFILALNFNLMISISLFAVMMIVGYYISTKQIGLGDLTKQNWIVIAGVGVIAFGCLMFLVPTLSPTILGGNAVSYYNIETTTTITTYGLAPSKVTSIDTTVINKGMWCFPTGSLYALWSTTGGQLRYEATGNNYVNVVTHEIGGSVFSGTTDNWNIECLKAGTYNICANFKGTGQFCKSVTVGG